MTVPLLFIDGEQVVSNDGDHGAILKTGSVNLSAGVHSIEVRYFENDGFATLDLDWSGPGFGRTQMQFDATVPPVPDPPQDPPASDCIGCRLLRSSWCCDIVVRGQLFGSADVDAVCD